MSVADILVQLKEAGRMIEALHIMIGQIRSDKNTLLDKWTSMPPMVTDIKISIGGFEDYTKKPAPLDDMVTLMKTGGVWIVRVGGLFYWVNSIDSLNKTAELVRLDSPGNKVTPINKADVRITGILPIAKYGA
jgi:hypothetical protein